MSDDHESDAIDSFAGAARAFCQLLDGPVTAAPLAAALVELHARALGLPDVAPDDSGVDMPTESARLPLPPLPFHLYWMIFDPLTLTPEEPVAGSLADDLGDIRADLLRGLELYDAGHVLSACWEWRFHFKGHWGAHLVSAQWALFCHMR